MIFKEGTRKTVIGGPKIELLHGVTVNVDLATVHLLPEGFG